MNDPRVLMTRSMCTTAEEVAEGAMGRLVTQHGHQPVDMQSLAELNMAGGRLVLTQAESGVELFNVGAGQQVVPSAIVNTLLSNCVPHRVQRLRFGNEVHHNLSFVFLVAAGLRGANRDMERVAVQIAVSDEGRLGIVGKDNAFTRARPDASAMNRYVDVRLANGRLGLASVARQQQLANAIELARTYFWNVLPQQQNEPADEDDQDEDVEYDDEVI